MRPAPRHAGFTIVELLAILMILGILSGVAAPRFYQAISETRVETTISHLKTIILAAELYYNDHGRWPDGAHEGEMHEDFVGYLRPNLFECPCPIGGLYDWDENNRDVVAAIAIFDEDPERSSWEEIDRQLDDGNLSTGDIQTMSDRGGDLLRWVLEY